MPQAMKNPVQHVMQIVYLHGKDVTSLNLSMTLDIDLKSIMALASVIKDATSEKTEFFVWIVRDEMLFCT